jgi:hypothetical protein
MDFSRLAAPRILWIAGFAHPSGKLDHGRAWTVQIFCAEESEGPRPWPKTNGENS